MFDKLKAILRPVSISPAGPDHCIDKSIKISGHYYVDLLGATFSIIPM